MSRQIRFQQVFLSILLCACAGRYEPPARGEERGACFPDGTCNAGLTCLSDLCVELPDDFHPGAPDGGPDDGTADCPGVVAILDSSQSATTIIEGESARLQVTACTVFSQLPVKYEWKWLSNTVVGEDDSILITTSSHDGGRPLNVRVVAFVDANNKVSHDFVLHVTNVDYAARLATYVSDAPAEGRKHQASSLALGGGKAFLAISNGMLLASPGYLEAIDLSEPSSPRLLGRTEIPNSSTVTTADGFVFVMGCVDQKREFQVFSEHGVTSGAPPLARVPIENGLCYLPRIQIEGGLAILLSGPEVLTIDVSDPSKPSSALPRLSVTNWGAESLLYRDGFLYGVGRFKRADSKLVTQLRIWDVRDWSAPIELEPFEVRDFFNSARIDEYDGRLYVLMNGSTAIFEIESPGVLRKLATPYLESGATIMTEVERIVFGANGGSIGIYDTQDPLSIEILGDLDQSEHHYQALNVVDGYLVASWHSYDFSKNDVGLEVMKLPE